MLMYEVLARDRMRADQEWASQQRLARRLVAARRWQRLARFADHRARRATERLKVEGSSRAANPASARR